MIKNLKIESLTTGATKTITSISEEKTDIEKYLNEEVLVLTIKANEHPFEANADPFSEGEKVTIVTDDNIELGRFIVGKREFMYDRNFYRSLN